MTQADKSLAPTTPAAAERPRLLTLPNVLTLSRIVALPLLAFLLWWPDWAFGYALAFALYCLMGITDYFDGYLARSSGAVSRLGIFLDPIADKIMVATVILVLTAQGYLRGPYVGDIHVVAGLVILVREIAVSGLREFLSGVLVSVPVSRLAKWKTTFQFVALGALILGGAVNGPPCELLLDSCVPRPNQGIHLVGLSALWAAAILTLVTGWDYLRVGLKHMD